MRHAPYLAAAATIVAAALTRCSSQDHPVRTYQMGERVNMGHIVYTVFETQWMTQLGEGPTPRVPQHRYFLVRMSATNSSNADVLVPNVTIEDDNGNTYREISNGDGVPQWMGFLRQVKPAEAAQGNVVFDAPPRHYRLRITDENEERVALIDIPLSFSAETPEVPSPGAAKKDSLAAPDMLRPKQ
jgi:hypothetical protein